MCDSEVYTVRIDSYGAASNSGFIGFLNIPLRNVVKAELLSASFGANTTILSNCVYLHIDELVSKFNTRTELAYQMRASNVVSTEGVASTFTISNVAQLATALLAFPVSTTSIADQRTIFTSAGNYPVEVAFIEPIRQIEKFTVKVLREDGGQPAITTGATYLTLKFTCARPNVCLYS